MSTSSRMIKEKPHEERQLIPKGKCLFLTMMACQRDFGDDGIYTVINLIILSGPFTGRRARFFKPIPYPELENENEIILLRRGSESIETGSTGGIETMSFPEWGGKTFHADVTHERKSDGTKKASLRGFDKYRLNDKDLFR